MVGDMRNLKITTTQGQPTLHYPQVAQTRSCSSNSTESATVPLEAAGFLPALVTTWASASRLAVLRLPLAWVLASA